MGSGTTILGAQRTKRKTYGIEIEPGYVDIAIRRWQEMSGEEAVMAASGQTFSQVIAERTSTLDGGSPLPPHSEVEAATAA